MRPNDVKKAVHDLLELVEDDVLEPAGARDLLGRLDRLAAALHDAPQDAPRTDREPPRRDGGELRRRVVARFPVLGLYRAPGLDPAGDGGVGDAVDDLVGLLLDLRDVAWLWEHAGPSDALPAREPPHPLGGAPVGTAVVPRGGVLPAHRRAFRKPPP